MDGYSNPMGDGNCLAIASISHSHRGGSKGSALINAKAFITTYRDRTGEIRAGSVVVNSRAIGVVIDRINLDGSVGVSWQGVDKELYNRQDQGMHLCLGAETDVGGSYQRAVMERLNPLSPWTSL